MKVVMEGGEKRMREGSGFRVGGGIGGSLEFVEENDGVVSLSRGLCIGPIRRSGQSDERGRRRDGQVKTR